ncbi:MAG: hypothetical protein JWP52_996, partial [Rhizobacter sp.]|nr:hypothetical protein [Rhizobacter sp.]
ALSPQAVFDKARKLMAYGGVPQGRADEVLDAASALMDALAGGDASSHRLMAEAFPDALLKPLFVAD